MQGDVCGEVGLKVAHDVAVRTGERGEATSNLDGPATANSVEGLIATAFWNLLMAAGYEEW